MTCSAATGKTFRPTSMMPSRWLRPSETCARFLPVRGLRDVIRSAGVRSLLSRCHKCLGLRASDT